MLLFRENMDLMKLFTPNRNNVVLTLILLFLTSIPAYKIDSTSGLLRLLVQSESFGNGTPLPFVISSTKKFLFIIPGETTQSISYINLGVDLLFWFIVSNIVLWSYMQYWGKKR